MKTIFQIQLILSLSLFVPVLARGDLGPDTQLNDVPGTSTLGEIVEAGGGGGGVNPKDFQSATNELSRSKMDKTDLAVYRKVKDIWTWSNYMSNGWSQAEAPADFLEAANSPGAMPLYFKAGMGPRGEWFGANQYWPSGNLKYDQGYGFSGDLGAMSTNLVFAFTAWSDSGQELYRFCAVAHRESATNETLVSWDGDTTDVPVRVNQFVRIATTDFVTRSVSNAVTSATNGIRKVDGSARALPKYLWKLEFCDSHENDAKWYYEYEDANPSPAVPGLCSARRSGNVLERNYDWHRDEAAEFVVLMEAGPGRFASAGVANIGENLTEEFVTSGAPSRFYKCLPGRTVDGVNSEGVAVEVNVVVTNGTASWEHHAPGDGRDIDSRWAVRWVLDRAPNAGWAASNLANRVYIAKSMLRRGYSVHYAIIDRESTWLVEDGKAICRPSDWAMVMTNFRLDTSPSSIRENDPYGSGYERYDALVAGSSITNVWYSNAYRRSNDVFPWPTEFAGVTNASGHRIENTETDLLQAWARDNIPPQVPDVVFPRGVGLWQTVHTSIYDISDLTLRVAVQENDDWHVFQVPSAPCRRAIKELVDTRLDATSVQFGFGTYASGKADVIAIGHSYEWTPCYGVTNAEGTVTLYEDQDHLTEIQPEQGVTYHAQDLSRAYRLTDGLVLADVTYANGRPVITESKAVSIGASSWSRGASSVSVGDHASAEGNGAVSIGPATRASGNYSICIGVGENGNTEAGESGIAMGLKSRALIDSLAIGRESYSPYKGGVAVGNRASTAGSGTGAREANSVAIGNNSRASFRSVAVGYLAKTSNKDSYDIDTANAGNTAIGYLAEATAGNSIAIGASAKASTWRSLAIGANAFASGAESIAIGSSASSASGVRAEATKQYACQIGPGTNSKSGSLKFMNTEIVGSDGKIPGDSVNWTGVISKDNPAFSNAVLAVQVDTNVLTAVAASTNAVAQISAFYEAFSDVGVTPAQGGMTLAGILAALVAAVVWLKRTLGKVVDNSGAATNDFAGDLLSKQAAKRLLEKTVDERLPVTLTVIADTPTGETVTGQTVTLYDGQAADPTKVVEQVSYAGNPVLFAIKAGHTYHVTISDTLAGYFAPTSETVSTQVSRMVTLHYKNRSSVTTFAELRNVIRTINDADRLRSIFLDPEDGAFEIADTWTSTEGTAYSNPMVVTDFDSYKGEDGEMHVGALMMRKYATYVGIPFGQAEQEVYDPSKTYPDGTRFYAYNPPEFEAGKSYATNEICKYTPDGGATWGVYFAKYAFTSGDAWDASKWTQYVVGKPSLGVNESDIANPVTTAPTPSYANAPLIFVNSLVLDTYEKKHVIRYGNNDWDDSAYRQYLNSEKTKAQGGWWEPKHTGQVAPNNAATIDGYLCGCSSALLSALGGNRVYVKTRKNIVTLGGAVTESLEKLFLPSGIDLYGHVNYSGGTYLEGRPNEYWRQATGYSTPKNEAVSTRAQYKESGHSTAAICWLRSSAVDNDCSVLCVATSGSITSLYAYNSLSSVPACVIY